MPARLILFILLAAVSPIRAEPSENAAPETPRLAHLRIDRENRCVDLLDATVIHQETREGEWLELLACTRGGREHEAVLRIPARPSHIHLALMLLGLEAGAPMKWESGPDGVRIQTMPRGPRIAVTARYENDAGETLEVPVNEWILNRATGKHLDDNVWLFTGSMFVRHEERNIYIADLEGSVLSLVNFGDEVLAKPTKQTRLTDDEAWSIAPDRVPPVGTKVTLRLRPEPEPER